MKNQQIISPNYTYRDVLFDAALLYGGSDQHYITDDIRMLLNAVTQVRSIPAEAIRRFQQLQGWLIDKPVPLAGEELKYFKSELGEALWLICSIKRQRNCWIDADALRYIFKAQRGRINEKRRQPYSRSILLTAAGVALLVTRQHFTFTNTRGRITSIAS